MDYEGMTPENTPIVRINWRDIVTVDNWGDDDEVAQPIECVTIGYLIGETATDITVAASYDYREERWGTKHSFPKTPPEMVMIKDQAPAVARELEEIWEKE